ncbi:MAG TPA: hypothetical protein VKV17_15460 [Bryobacteraceae bacterium]|nr:hypothetical protein [Bryobacteraceae bacterium]
MKWAVCLLLGGCAIAADGPSLFYSKSFPGSKPAYVQINLSRKGEVEYREAPDEDNPVRFQLTEAEANEVFGLVDKAGSLKRPLESHLKVAFMGTKTLRLENGEEKNQVEFNYTLDPAGQALAEWFERMAETAQRRIELERTAKYDKLGVVDALLQLQISMDKKRIVDPEQFLPLLDRLANNESYMHTARARAAEVAAAIRNPAPKP